MPDQSRLIPKAWVSYDQVTPAINDSENVTSVTDTSTGLFTVFWATDFADTTYNMVTGGCDDGNDRGVTVSEDSTGSTRLAGSCVYESRDTASTPALRDQSFNAILAFGDLSSAPSVDHPALMCRGWVHYDHVTPTINDSENVASVTDSAAGEFIVNWDIDFSDSAYAAVSGCNDGNEVGTSNYVVHEDNSARAVGATTFRAGRVRNSATYTDLDEVSVAAVGAVATGSPWNMPRLIAKAWVNYDQVSATPVVEDSENVSSVTDNGLGDFTLNWDTDFGSANYAAVMQVSNEDLPDSNAYNIQEIGTGAAHLAASLQCSTSRQHNNTTRVDARSGVMAFGDQ